MIGANLPDADLLRVSRCLDTRPLLEPLVLLAAIGGKIVPKNGNTAIGVNGGFAADRSAVVGHPGGAGGAFKALVDSLEPAGMDFVRFDIGVAFDSIAADVAAIDANKVLGVAGHRLERRLRAGRSRRGRFSH